MTIFEPQSRRLNRKDSCRTDIHQSSASNDVRISSNDKSILLVLIGRPLITRSMCRTGGAAAVEARYCRQLA